MHHAPRDIFSRLRGETRCRSPLSRSGEKYGDGRVEQAGPLGLGDQPLSVPLRTSPRSASLHGERGFDAAANICARRGGRGHAGYASKRCGATPADRRQPAIAPQTLQREVLSPERRDGGFSASLRPFRVMAIGRRRWMVVPLSLLWLATRRPLTPSTATARRIERVKLARL
jgi:hypothetical protein